MKPNFSIFALASAVVLLPLASPPSALARTWTQSETNRTIEADLVKVSGDKAVLKLRTGQLAEVPIRTLSADDQAFILAQSKGAQDSSGAASWPQWRGPLQNGISPDKNLLKEWPKDGPKKLWTYDNAGMGYSGFSIADGLLFTLGTRGADLYVIAINAEDGKEVWSRKAGTDEQKGYSTGWGHGPRSTPTVSEGKVYALGPQGSLDCLDAAKGTVIWSKDLVKDFGGKAGGWGFSESPLVDGTRLVVAPGGQTPLVALDKKSGELVWKSAIEGAGAAEYATVVVAELDGVRQYIKLFQKLLVGVNAETGAEIWRSTWTQGATAVIPTPIVDGNRVYITSGYGAGSKLVEVKGGTATDVWVNKEMKNHHGGVIKIGDNLYGFSDGGGLICQSWTTGSMVWNEKSQFLQKGAVHVADGMLYCLNESDGMLTLVEASPSGFSAKGQFKLDPQSPNRNPQGKVWTHPLVLNGKLYLRDQEFLSCFDVKG
ncbi:MAG: Outer membrane protein assembly factor BamB, contains PQQ-like beta-propeller repeat [Verrucomicrobia bacterium]|nr:MAG: Outer membrane protein assembly factor BamB, contains PQQ-like beta-propeller repeat [Verrucomicrobiota bacterium]